MSKARPNNRRVFRNRPAIKYHSQFHNVIGSVMRNRSGWIKANEEDEKKVDFFWVETLFMHEQFDNIYFAEHVKGNTMISLKPFKSKNRDNIDMDARNLNLKKVEIDSRATTFFQIWICSIQIDVIAIFQVERFYTTYAAKDLLRIYP